MTNAEEPDTDRTVVALVGARDMLAGAVRRLAPPRRQIVGLDLPDFDVTVEECEREALDRIGPRVIVNCAADTDVDGCEEREPRATAVNGTGVAHLAAAALKGQSVFVQVSTDFVFDGGKSAPYVEDDPPAPLSAYGRSKLAGERAVRESGLRRFYRVRTSWLYGEGGENFVTTVTRLARERSELRIVEPLRLRGPVVTRSIRPVRTEDEPRPARRPACSALSTAKYETATGATVAPWVDALRRFLDARFPIAHPTSAR